jgi:cytochrome c peroxidase
LHPRGGRNLFSAIARSTRWAAALGVATTVAAGPIHADDRARFGANELAAIARHAAGPALPDDPTNAVADDPRAGAFGQRLFFDKRLSVNGRFSCASCHLPARAFADGRALAEALARGTRNTPSLLNAATNHWFFWDGRADTLWAQPLQVIENPREFGSDRAHAARVVANDARLRAGYTALFGPLPPFEKPGPSRATPVATSPGRAACPGVSENDRTGINRVFANIGKALAAYMRKLVRHDSPFDRYAAALAKGDTDGEARYPAAAKRGLKLFVGRGGCELCHSGPEFTDGEFHNVGLPAGKRQPPDTGREDGLGSLAGNPFTAAGCYSDAPKGDAAERLAYLPASADKRGAFKTPSLRNAARTAPYMHDGRFKTLTQVVTFYAEGKKAAIAPSVGAREGTLDLIPTFTHSEIADLVAFLKTLDSAPLPRALTHPPAAR